MNKSEKRAQPHKTKGLQLFDYSGKEGTTEQESWTGFRIDYIKLNGRRAFYYPDWIVVQSDGKKEKYWIIETKGRIWPDTHLKDEAIKYWCETVSKSMNQSWNYFRVNQLEFGSKQRTAKLLEDVVVVQNTELPKKLIE